MLCKTDLASILQGFSQSAQKFKPSLFYSSSSIHLIGSLFFYNRKFGSLVPVGQLSWTSRVPLLLVDGRFAFTHSPHCSYIHLPSFTQSIDRSTSFERFHPQSEEDGVEYVVAIFGSFGELVPVDSSRPKIAGHIGRHQEKGLW